MQETTAAEVRGKPQHGERVAAASRVWMMRALRWRFRELDLARYAAACAAARHARVVVEAALPDRDDGRIGEQLVEAAAAHAVVPRARRGCGCRPDRRADARLCASEADRLLRGLRLFPTGRRCARNPRPHGSPHRRLGPAPPLSRPCMLGGLVRHLRLASMRAESDPPERYEPVLPLPLPSALRSKPMSSPSSRPRPDQRRLLGHLRARAARRGRRTPRRASASVSSSAAARRSGLLRSSRAPRAPALDVAVERAH